MYYNAGTYLSQISNSASRLPVCNGEVERDPVLKPRPVEQYYERVGRNRRKKRKDNHVLKQIAQHRNELKQIQNGRKICIDLKWIRNAGFSLKRGVKPVNKVGAVNYKEPVTHKRTVIRSYNYIRGIFLHRN